MLCQGIMSARCAIPLECCRKYKCYGTVRIPISNRKRKGRDLEEMQGLARPLIIMKCTNTGLDKGEMRVMK